MKFLMVFFFVVLSNILFGQLSGDIAVGYNRFANNYNDYKRTDGFTFQFCLEKTVTDIFGLSYGLNVSVAHENYTYNYHSNTFYNQTVDSIYYSISITDKFEYYSISVQYPIVLVTELISNKLYFQSGISLNIDNFLILGDLFLGSDPELSQPKTHYDYYLHGRPAKGLGFGHQLGFLYKPANKLGIYGEWKSTKNKAFEFSYMEVGIKYRIFTNR